MSQALRDSVLDYLRKHHVMTLATSGPDGPWGAAVFYVNDGFDFYFLSNASTRHCANLLAMPRAAATIQEDCADWRQIKGVQLEGAVVELHGIEAAKALALYGAKFPIVANLAGAPAAIARAMARVSWYRLAADTLHFIDNSRGFGHRDTLPRS